MKGALWVKYQFLPPHAHHVTEANINYYASPFIHPKRKMDAHDFIYLLQGEWKIGQEGEEYHLKKDHLLILFAGETHYGTAPCAAGTKTLYFHLSKGQEDRLLSLQEEGIAALTDASEHREIKRIFTQLVESKLAGNQRKADLYFELLLCALLEHRDEGEGIPQKIRRIIVNHPEKFFSNGELAERLNISVKTAETKFKAHFGQTIHQYMLEFKIREAISYFENFPEISIKETALNLGFYDEYHFSKQFKKITGISPREYRKKMK